MRSQMPPRLSPPVTRLCTLPPCAAPILKETNRLQAKRPQVMTMNLTGVVKNFQIQVYESVSLIGKSHIKALRILLLSSQTLRGMNFQRNLNTHKPETMMVLKKAATGQAD